MQILQGYISGDVCITGSLDNRMRELITVTVLTALPQLKVHVQASLNAENIGMVRKKIAGFPILWWKCWEQRPGTNGWKRLWMRCLRP